MKKYTKIVNGEIIHNIERRISLITIKAITGYMGEMDTDITFKGGDTEDYYNKLLDSTGLFKYTDCDTLFTLGILQSYSFSYNDNLKFGFSDDYKERLKGLYRLDSINTVLG